MGPAPPARATLPPGQEDQRAVDEAASALDAAMPTLMQWIGRARTVEEEITLGAARRIAATFDCDPDALRPGAPLPAHWFNLFFADIARQGALGPDGHPRAGEFLPPIPLPHRMGAGRRVVLHGCLHVGDAATRRTEVAAIVPKAARSGPICILTMRNTVAARGRTLVVEEFDAIYRDATRQAARTDAAAPASPAAAWEDTLPLDPAQVFRYGAITWNAHRIHYDADYARATEGYPGPVMNGGLTMHLLLAAALRRAAGRLAGYETRLLRPLFVGEVARFGGTAPDAGRMHAWVTAASGALAAEMRLEFAA